MYTDSSTGGTTVSGSIVSSATGSLIAQIDQINAPYFWYGDTRDAPYEPYGFWFSEDIDVSVGEDKFLVVWRGDHSNASGHVIYGRLFSKEGASLTESFVVSNQWGHDVQQPISSSADCEEFSVAYTSRYPKSLFIDHFDIDSNTPSTIPNTPLTLQESSAGLIPEVWENYME